MQSAFAAFAIPRPGPMLTKSEPSCAGPIWKGRRRLRIWSFRGSFANRGSEMQLPSSDVGDGSQLLPPCRICNSQAGLERLGLPIARLRRNLTPFFRPRRRESAFPSAGRAAGKIQAAFGNGEGELLAVGAAAELFGEDALGHIAQNRRRETRGVGVDEHKERLV